MKKMVLIFFMAGVLFMPYAQESEGLAGVEQRLNSIEIKLTQIAEDRKETRSEADIEAYLKNLEKKIDLLNENLELLRVTLLEMQKEDHILTNREFEEFLKDVEDVWPTWDRHDFILRQADKTGFTSEQVRIILTKFNFSDDKKIFKDLYPYISDKENILKVIEIL